MKKEKQRRHKAPRGTENIACYLTLPETTSSPAEEVQSVVQRILSELEKRSPQDKSSEHSVH